MGTGMRGGHGNRPRAREVPMAGTPHRHTLIHIFLDSVAKFDNPSQFMRRTDRGWESISARRALEDVESLALGLRDLGVVRGDRVAILSENRYEWPIADLAILRIGAITGPIYHTLIAEQ